MWNKATVRGLVRRLDGLRPTGALGKVVFLVSMNYLAVCSGATNKEGWRKQPTSSSLLFGHRNPNIKAFSVLNTVKSTENSVSIEHTHLSTSI